MSDSISCSGLLYARNKLQTFMILTTEGREISCLSACLSVATFGGKGLSWKTGSFSFG